MKKGIILENIKVEKLVFGGKGFVRLEDGKVVFITGGAVPGSIVNIRILKKRKDYLEGQIVETIMKSPIEKEHPNNPYGKSGGCKWVNIPYEEQTKIKEMQVREALFHLEKSQKEIPFGTIVPSPTIDGYRNKLEFSFGKFISKKYDIEQHFNVGFHKQGEFSKIEDFDGSILGNFDTNRIYKIIKDFCKNSGLPVYDQMRHEGFFRHLMVRHTHFTNEMMLILGYNPNYNNGDFDIDFIEDFLQKLGEKEECIKSIYFSINDNKADIAIGKLKNIYGQNFIQESLHGLMFNISPKSFFQTNSTGAETLYQMVLDMAHKESLQDSTVLDLYAGTGTIGMLFAKYAKEIYSVEMVEQSSKNGAENAVINSIKNMKFINKKTEDFLKDFKSENKIADLLIVDPPRAGMHPDALKNILEFNSKQIIYVSCNPSTLARDLAYILENNYKIEQLKPMDMFPHTHHIETVVSLVKK